MTEQRAPSSGARPQRFDQIIPSIVEFDAVSNHTFEAQRLLRTMGFESEIFAGNIGPGCAGRVRPLGEIERVARAREWVIYQCSIGSPAAELFAALPCHKVLDYHNITPDRLVDRWLPALGVEARLGRQQLSDLASLVPYAIADSAFNARELDAAGFPLTRVVPVLIESGNFADEPEVSALARLAAQKRAGGTDWLFVGQLAPHKAQHDVVKAFACYRHVYDPQARLHLVGREMGSTYRDALGRFIRALGLEPAVDLPGPVSTGQLAAYYASADVFVCCSEHEGFCAPVIEAMARSLPVVSTGAGALGETVGDGGIVLDSKSPVQVAAAVHLVCSDNDLRRELVERGLERAAQYTLGRSGQTFVAAIDEALVLGAAR